MTTKRKPTSTPAQPAPPEFPVAIETFHKPGSYERGQWVRNAPSVGNGEVSVRRFRITVEEIAEPVEVLAERLRGLWRGTTNHHHWDPLKAEARRLGVTLDDRELGADVKGRET
jgi:hypothetical protein